MIYHQLIYGRTTPLHIREAVIHVFAGVLLLFFVISMTDITNYFHLALAALMESWLLGWLLSERLFRWLLL